MVWSCTFVSIVAIARVLFISAIVNSLQDHRVWISEASAYNGVPWRCLIATIEDSVVLTEIQSSKVAGGLVLKSIVSEHADVACLSCITDIASIFIHGY